MGHTLQNSGYSSITVYGLGSRESVVVKSCIHMSFSVSKVSFAQPLWICKCLLLINRRGNDT